MAYVPKKKEEFQKAGRQFTQGVSSGGSSSFSSQAKPAGAQAGTGFHNLKAFIGKNKGATTNFANEVGSGIEKKASDAEAQMKFNPQAMDTGWKGDLSGVKGRQNFVDDSPKIQQPKMFSSLLGLAAPKQRNIVHQRPTPVAQPVTVAPPTPAAPVTIADSFRNSVQAGVQPVDHTLAKQVAASGNAADAAKLKEQLDAPQYTGPRDFESSEQFGQLKDLVGNAKSQAALTGTQSGLQELSGQNASTSAGGNALNAYLLNNTADATGRIQNAAKSTAGLDAGLTATGKTATDIINTAFMDGVSSKDSAMQQIRDAESLRKYDLGQKATQTQIGNTAAFGDIQNKLSSGRELTDQDLAAIGMTREQWAQAKAEADGASQARMASDKAQIDQIDAILKNPMTEQQRAALQAERARLAEKARTTNYSPDYSKYLTATNAPQTGQSVASAEDYAYLQALESITGNSDYAGQASGASGLGTYNTDQLSADAGANAAAGRESQAAVDNATAAGEKQSQTVSEQDAKRAKKKKALDQASSSKDFRGWTLDNFKKKKGDK